MNRRPSRAERELASAFISLAFESAKVQQTAKPENVLTALANASTEELNQIRAQLETKADAQAKPLEQRVTELQAQIEAIRTEARTQISVIDTLLSARSKPVGFLQPLKQ